MAMLYLVSERGDEVKQSTFLPAELMQATSERRLSYSKMGLIFELLSTDISVINNKQAKELLIDFCRLDFEDWASPELYCALNMLAKCSDGIHLKMIFSNEI